MRRYRDGAVFVRGVQESVGVEGFNAVWTSPETLPLAAEITDPRRGCDASRVTLTCA